MVNTAEALFVLSMRRGASTAIDQGLQFIKANCFEHVALRGNRIRYVAFPLLVLSSQFPKWNRRFQASLKKWLIEARNDDGAWGIEARDQRSDLFSTYIAVAAIYGAYGPDDAGKATAHWILSKGSSSGWHLTSAVSPRAPHGISLVATAYAVLTLTTLRETDHDLVETGKELLLQVDHWENEEETVAGTVWKHCTYSHVIQALLSLDVDPFSRTVAEGVRHSNRLFTDGIGWRESEYDGTPTVRSQYWAVTALNLLHTHIDPSKHVPRVDAERAEGTLLEPEFIKFHVRTPWAIILPRKLYVGVTWAMLCISFLLFLGAENFVPRISGDIVGILFLVAVWVLISKRKHSFPRLARIGVRAVALLGIMNLVFGESLLSLWDSGREYIYGMFSKYL
jgi:hypothetical protein